MNSKTTIRIKEYDSESGRYDDTGETLSTHTLARSMTPENFTALFDDFLNLGGKDFLEGKQIGLQLRSTHRTLQRLAICFAFGIIAGLSEQEYTDPRNESAIQTAQKVANMLHADLPHCDRYLLDTVGIGVVGLGRFDGFESPPESHRNH